MPAQSSAATRAAALAPAGRGRGLRVAAVMPGAPA
jgi:hypothetical protein